MQYVFHSRAPWAITLKIRGKMQRFGIKAVFPFDSKRKMMSVVCKTYQGEYILFTKGSDNNVLPRCNIDELELQNAYARSKQFASEGLRTIVFAYRRFDRETYKRFK